MGGIYGVVFHDQSRQLSPNQLDPMATSLGRSIDRFPVSVGLGAGAVGVRQTPGYLAGAVEIRVTERRLALAFHGSLYNWRELTALAGEDSEPLRAILKLYMNDGMAFLQRLRGDFVLAIWDGLNESCYLALDRFRVEALFYYADREKLVFASRIGAILACPLGVEATIDPAAVVDVVAVSAIPTPRTVFKEIRKLPPGHLLTLHKGESRVSSYWDVDFRESSNAAKGELVMQLRDYFSDAVRVRVESDGPPERLGTFLSGGVDSSTVTGVMTRLLKRPVKSFSIGFEEPRFNEMSFARTAARAFGAEHYERFVTARDTVNAIPVLLEAFDEPFGNASAVPTYLCAKMAAEHGVDRLYAGDGGDELFAGNERYATQRLFDYYHRIPAWLRDSFAEPLVNSLAGGLKRPMFIKAKKYIRRANIPYPKRLSSYGFFEVVPMVEMLEDGLLEAIGTNYDPYDAMSYHYFRAPARSELDRQLYIDLKLAIADNDLFKVTRGAEAAGVAVRFPFLDHRLAEFAAGIPVRIKMRGRRLRSFFKEAYADLLPPETTSKRKHGFGLPIPVWLRTDRELNEMMMDLVLSSRSVQRGYFRRKTLQELVNRHRTDETSFYGTAIWNLMALELWHRAREDSFRVRKAEAGQTN